MLRFSSAERCQIFWLIYPEWSVLLIEEVSLCNNFYLLRCSIKCAFEDTQRHLVMSQNLKFFPNYFFFTFSEKEFLPEEKQKIKGLNIPRTKRDIEMKWSTFFIIFERLLNEKKKERKRKKKIKKICCTWILGFEFEILKIWILEYILLSCIYYIINNLYYYPFYFSLNTTPKIKSGMM